MTPPAADRPTARHWPVDRAGAAVRGFWRLLAAAGGGALLRIPIRNLEWRLLWEQQRLVAASWGLVLGLSAVALLLFAVAAVRWLLLALWPGRLGIDLQEDGIGLRAGPFGCMTLDRRRVQVSVEGDVDLDTLAQLPPDSVAIELRHPDCPEEIVGRLQRFAGGHAQQVRLGIREWLLAGDAPPGHADRRP